MLRNFPFTLYTYNVDSTLWKKCSFCSKNVSSIKKLLISKAESFVKSNFDINQICKTVFTQSHYIWNFGATDWHFVFFKRLVKYFEVMENIKKLKFEGDWDELWPKICLLRQSGTCSLLSTLPVLIQLFRKSAHLAPKSQFYQKTTNKQSWKLCKVKFWHEPKMQNSAYTKSLYLGALAQLTGFLFSLKG